MLLYLLTLFLGKQFCPCTACRRCCIWWRGKLAPKLEQKKDDSQLSEKQEAKNKRKRLEAEKKAAEEEAKRKRLEAEKKTAEEEAARNKLEQEKLDQKVKEDRDEIRTGKKQKVSLAGGGEYSHQSNVILTSTLDGVPLTTNLVVNMKSGNPDLRIVVKEFYFNGERLPLD